MTAILMAVTLTGPEWVGRYLGTVLCHLPGMAWWLGEVRCP